MILELIVGAETIQVVGELYSNLTSHVVISWHDILVSVNES